MKASEKQLPVHGEPGSVQSLRVDVGGFEEIWKHVANADFVTSRLGSMPSLHDAEIVEITLARDGAPSARLTLKAMPYDPRGQGGTYLITLLFKNVAEVNLEYFNEQNVIWGLYVDLASDQKRLVIQPIYGLEGGFSFSEATVLEADTIHPEQR